jgi:hypothetical protein
MARPEACRDFDECKKNCPASTIKVDSGIGCAAAMISTALRGRKEVVCGEGFCE